MDNQLIQVNQLANKNLEDSKSEIELDNGIIDALNLLVKAAEENQDNITSEEISNLEKTLEDLEKDRSDTLDKISKEMEEDFKQIENAIKQCTEQLNLQSSLYEEELASKKNLLEKYVEEKRELTSKLNLGPNEESTEKTVVAQRIEWVSEKIQKLEFEISELEKEKEEYENSMLEYARELLASYKEKYDVAPDEKRKPAEETPQIKIIDEEINRRKAELDFYKRTPSQIKTDIISAMKAGKSKEEVKAELDILISKIKGEKIIGILNIGKFQDLESEIARRKKELTEVQERYNQNNYIDKAQKARDEKQKEIYREKETNMTSRLKALNDEKLIVNEKKSEKDLKRDLKRIEQAIKGNEEQKEFFSKYNPEKAKAYDTIIADLKNERNKIQSRLEYIYGLPISKPEFLIDHEIQKLENKINDAQGYVKYLNESDYTDYEAKRLDKELIDALEDNIRNLEKTRANMKENDVNQLATRTLELYVTNQKQANAQSGIGEVTDSLITGKDNINGNIKENRLEEVKEFLIEVPKKIIEKIKSLSFTNKALEYLRNAAINIGKDNQLIEETVTTNLNNPQERKEVEIENPKIGSLYAISQNGEKAEIRFEQINDFVDAGYDVKWAQAGENGEIVYSTFGPQVANETPKNR